ncbi:MAG: hypothetical protein VW945_06685, partial [Candidatus Poseidoniales archaeon]
WSGTLDLNISLSTREIHTAVHALVSSLFEVVTGLGPMVDGHTRIEAAVLNGSKAFKELFYRGERVSISGVDPSGKLVLSGRTEGIDDPEDLTWSIR